MESQRYMNESEYYLQETNVSHTNMADHRHPTLVHQHTDNDEVAYILLPVVLYTSILMVFGILGNSVVCYIYFVKWQNKTVKYFIGTLSLYDLITCAVCMPIEIAMLRNPIELDDPYLCKFLRFTRAVTSLGSGFLLVVIAIDRYRRICKHAQSQIEVTTAKKLCIITGIVATVFSWPCFLIFGSLGYQNVLIAETSCSTDRHLSDTIYPTIYYGIIFLLFFGISICLVVFYLMIGVKLCKLPVLGSKKVKTTGSATESLGTSSQDDTCDVPKRERSNSTYKKGSNTVSKGNHVNRTGSVFDFRSAGNNFGSLRRGSQFIRRRRTTITLFLITLVQWLSFLPYVGLLVCRSVIPDFLAGSSTAEQVTFNIGILSHFLSSGLNPFVYSCFSKDFRKECKRTWREITRVSSSALLQIRRKN